VTCPTCAHDIPDALILTAAAKLHRAKGNGGGRPKGSVDTKPRKKREKKPQVFLIVHETGYIHAKWDDRPSANRNLKWLKRFEETMGTFHIEVKK
jgi:hypothetical protein